MEKSRNDLWKISLQTLKNGNIKYLQAQKSDGDISPEIRKNTFQNGQKPYAVIITCADSRVIPEYIFSVGIGDLFVIRAAGNTIETTALASVEYAISHLKTPLVVVLGHTCCGAIHAAIHGGKVNGYIKAITDKIRITINNEQNDTTACRLNVNAGVNEIEQAISKLYPNVKIIGAVYRIDTGEVEFIDELVNEK